MPKQKSKGNLKLIIALIQHTILGLVLVATQTFLEIAVADEKVPASPERQNYHIYGGTLSHALSQFAGNAGIMLAVDARLTDGKTSKGLNGVFTLRQGLAQLLAGTGLVYTINDNKVNIRAADKAPKRFLPVANPSPGNPEPMSDTTLPKVTVEADSAYDPEYYADLYNKDYVIPNATAGTKTDTPIMETPLNVQVISKQVLKDRQVIRLADALKNVSGVTTTTGPVGFGRLGGTQQTLFLRGFSAETFFRDGFRLQQGSSSRELANVESVEVLKGSAAILYGLVEPGGMVNVVTKKPLATPYYGFTQQFGSYDQYRTTLDATGPIAGNKDVLYRVNLSYENSGSFRQFVGTEDVFFAPKLTWNISPRTQATFELEYNRQRLGTDNGFIPFIGGKLYQGKPLSFNWGEYSPATTETIFGSFNWSHQFNDDWSLKHRFSVNQSNISSPDGTRPGLAGTGQFLRDFLYGLGFPNDPNLNGLAANKIYVARETNGKSITQFDTYATNLDLTGHFDTWGLKHTLLLGGDYYRLDSLSAEQGNDFNSYIELDNPQHPGTPIGPSFPLTFAPPSKVDQYGLYIQDQIKLPYDVHVMGGIRWQYIDTNGDVQDAVTPRVGVLWQPQKWLSLYANYVESFGANTGKLWPDSRPIDPTSAEQIEGGIKAEFFGGKLRANLAYFDLTKTNVAVTDLSHQAPACGGGCSLAIGAVRSRGPEVDITGEILPGWNVIATYSNLDMTVIETNADGERIDGIKPGDRFPWTSRNTGSFWSTYEVQNGGFKGLSFGGGITLRDSQLAANLDGEGANFKLPGYATVDLMASYSRKVGDATVSLQLNVNNLLDKDYLSSMSSSTFGKVAWTDIGQPRTFMGQVSVQY